MKRLRHILDYYKVHLAIVLILICMTGYSFHRHITKKDPVLYGALINIAASESLTADLSRNFLRSETYLSSVKDASPDDLISMATGWYLTDHPDSGSLSYTRATQMKILASINAQQLDLILMDREAFDAFAQNGYLLDLSTVTDLKDQYSSCFIENMEIVEDNAKDVALDPSIPYTSVTKEYPMALDLSACPLIQQASLSGTVYLGIISNTPRLDQALVYTDYLFSP